MNDDKKNTQEIEKQQNTSNIYSLLEKTVPRFIDIFENKIKYQETPIKKHSLWIVAILLFFILAGTFTLVLLNKASDSVFTFVVGTVTGFLLSVSKSFFSNDKGGWGNG